MLVAALVMALTTPTRRPAVWIVNDELLNAVIVPVAEPPATKWGAAEAAQGRASAKHSAQQLAKRRFTRNPFKANGPALYDCRARGNPRQAATADDRTNVRRPVRPTGYELAGA
jgi:hypothetical protein